MPDIKKQPLENLSKNFISSLTKEELKKSNYRNLDTDEINILIKNNNYSENWNNVLVTDPFNPELIKNSEFYGFISIGKTTSNYLEYHELKLPVGITNSTIISSHIGNDVVIRNVSYLSHYIIEDECILFNIKEMITTDHAKFGNGILKEGENESLRIWLEVCNENEGRKILPFESMITADAYLWSKFRDDEELMAKLKNITESSYNNKKSNYGVIGKNSIIKNSLIIKDVKVGENAYIKGANKLKNLTILSSREEATQIGEGVELVNGIIGYGSKIFYGSKAVRFITGRNTQLKYGARLINSILGDNSTVSCCELLNNLIFPFHEQHHNNSFLIAATILGQTNIAAGATIGSNHNSRTPDGEIVAGRGFWPGLCTSFKHNSKFASFVLVSKGDYDFELNIEYPFSLLSLDKANNCITITPAYWFMYNMYAIARNISKFAARDKRKIKIQNIEIDYLAPDTISEILKAVDRLEMLLDKQCQNNFSPKKDDEIAVFDDTQAKKTKVKIIKPLNAIKTYKQMCYYFVIDNIISYFNITSEDKLSDLIKKIRDSYESNLYLNWWNLGGQLIPEEELSKLIKDIKNNKLSSWEEIHKRYNLLWEQYPKQKLRYAFYVLEKLDKINILKMNASDWKSLLKKCSGIYADVYKAAYSSREKDYTDKFRMITFNNHKEMENVIGKIENNHFLNELKEKIDYKIKIMESLYK
jgi:hypothetical protein